MQQIHFFIKKMCKLGKICIKNIIIKNKIKRKLNLQDQIKNVES